MMRPPLLIPLLFTLLVLPLAPQAIAEEPRVKDVLEEVDEGQDAASEVPEPPSGPVDSFDRGTPLSSFTGLSTTLEDAEFENAAEYLDLRYRKEPASSVGGPELARQLKVVLERGLLVDRDALSRDPGGILDDGLPPDRDLLGRVRIEDQRIDLYLQRVPRGDGVDIWKIASISANKIPDLYRYFGYGPIGEVLSRTLPDFEILGLRIWQWLLVIGLLVAGYLIALIPTWVIAWFLHLRGSANEAEFLKFLGGPLRLLLAVLIARSGADLIHPGMMARAYLEGQTLLTILLAWCFVWTVELVRQQFARKLEAGGHSSAIVLTRPAANLCKFLILLIAFLVWYENLGFKATSLIAGLGIGGLAVALATQKPLENLISAITLLSSTPVRVGDFCRIGDKMGLVEEIGLRATKVRTLQRTAVHIPNSVFVNLQIENITERERILFQHKLRLRYDTAPLLMQNLLEALRALLASHSRVDPEPARVRFIGFGDSYLELELYAYVNTRDWSEYLEISEGLHLRILEIIRQEGVELAYPTRTVNMEGLAMQEKHAV